MKGHVARKRDRDYAVIYEGLDPVTGKERRTWHPAGTDRAEAEALVTRLAAERDGRNDEVRSLTLGAYLTGHWLPTRRARSPRAPDHWPEFAANGKATITTGHVMGHTAGLPGFDPAVPVATLYDWEACCANLAAQSPWWAPGTASGYHALTQGYLQGEIVRRITGQSLGTFFREVVAGPLGADFHIGVPPDVDRSRIAELVAPDLPFGDATAGHGSVAARATSSCPLDAREAMTEAWREAEIPSAGGTANARGVARIHSALACSGAVDGVKLLSPSGVDAALVKRHRGTDLVLNAPMRLGTGFGLPSPETPVSPNERALYWGGWGGSLCVIDLDLQMSFAYVMNKMTNTTAGDFRAAGPLLETYVALDQQRPGGG